jgi:hypothetical protein
MRRAPEWSTRCRRHSSAYDTSAVHGGIPGAKS